MNIEHVGWLKIPRLLRDCVITEKIDGTNGAIGIAEADQEFTGEITKTLFTTGPDGRKYLVWAQSRNRIITPEADNYGFAGWVYDNATTLIGDLNAGLHFGEWWGRGIGRGYGLDYRIFSLFNTSRWAGEVFGTWNLSTVPVLSECVFDTQVVMGCLRFLQFEGSYAAPGFKPAEGVCVYHKAANQVFKVTLENDQQPKTVAGSIIRSELAA